jgi:alpha-glucuronidase
MAIGFERTSKGSNALGQYTPEVQRIYERLEDCPENYLLWFHHVRWDYKMKSGRDALGRTLQSLLQRGGVSTQNVLSLGDVAGKD